MRKLVQPVSKPDLVLFPVIFILSLDGFNKDVCLINLGQGAYILAM